MYKAVWQRGLKLGCKLSPVLFSLLVNYIAKIVMKYGKHGIQLMADTAIIYLFLLAADIVLISDTVVGLQSQLNNLEKGAATLGLEVNYVKTKVVVFRNAGFLADHEKWLLKSFLPEKQDTHYWRIRADAVSVCHMHGCEKI